MKSTIEIDRESKVTFVLMAFVIALAVIGITPAAIAAFKPPFAFVAAAIATMAGFIAGHRLAWLVFPDRWNKTFSKAEAAVMVITWILAVFGVAGLTGYTIYHSTSLVADYAFLACGIVILFAVGWANQIVTTEQKNFCTQKIMKSDGTV